MKYNEMFNEFKKYVGVSDNKLSKYIIENNIDEQDGMHIWFEFVVTPFLLDAIKNNKTKEITKSFEFIELCLNSKDKEITEVIEFSLLEGIVADIGININILDKYLGNETKKSIVSIKKYIINN